MGNAYLPIAVASSFALSWRAGGCFGPMSFVVMVTGCRASAFRGWDPVRTLRRCALFKPKERPQTTQQARKAWRDGNLVTPECAKVGAQGRSPSSNDRG